MLAVLRQIRTLVDLSRQSQDGTDSSLMPLRPHPSATAGTVLRCYDPRR
eukprot:COSAG06_NODE_24971_length_648_cov_0.912568_1_plen_48_part_10